MVATTRERTAPERKFLSPKDFAAITDVSERHALDMVKEGVVGHIRLGRSVRIPASEIERLRQEAEARRIGA